MSTTHPRFSTRIEGSPETIFDLITDMPNYGKEMVNAIRYGGLRDRIVT
jgi:hypothetical protein